MYFLALPLKQDHDNRLSSYESLNNCTTLETLKLSDYGHRQNEKRACIYVSNNDTDDNLHLAIKPVQGYPQEIHLDSNITTAKNSSGCKIINIRSNIHRIEITAATADTYHQASQCDEINDNNNDDDKKQRQLSDWYYIKTSSKSKSYAKNASPYVRRKFISGNSNNNNFHSHYHHGSAQSLLESSKTDVTNHVVPIPVVRKFPPKSPVSYARRCYNARHQKQQQSNLLTARIGEITSNSFEHVNIASASVAANFPEIIQEKQFNNNSLDATRIYNNHINDDVTVANTNSNNNNKYRDARRRPLPLIPIIPPPSSPPPPPSQMSTMENNVKQNEVYIFNFIYVLVHT